MTKYLGIHSSVYLSEEEVEDIRKNLQKLILMSDKPSALEKYAYLSLKNSGKLNTFLLPNTTTTSNVTESKGD